ncbi:MAG TPA: hypothetical protein VFT87_03995 [Candidatus Saccharimonadales bacterium]|nr:hypothetical protein [Candidatus Saccharimonadales bacterium]
MRITCEQVAEILHTSPAYLRNRGVCKGDEVLIQELNLFIAQSAHGFSGDIPTIDQLVVKGALITRDEALAFLRPVGVNEQRLKSLYNGGQVAYFSVRGKTRHVNPPIFYGPSLRVLHDFLQGHLQKHEVEHLVDRCRKFLPTNSLTPVKVDGKLWFQRTDVERWLASLRALPPWITPEVWVRECRLWYPQQHFFLKEFAFRFGLSVQEVERRMRAREVLYITLLNIPRLL